MRKTFLLVLGGFILLVAVVVVLIYRAALPPPRTPVIIDLPSEGETPPPVINNPVAPTSAVERAAQTSEEDEEEAKEKKREEIRAAWQDAMDNMEDEERILQESIKLMKHPDPEIRLSAIEGFRWIGAKGLVPLMDMLYDKNPEVAREAAEAWLDEMGDLEDEAAKAEILANVYDVDSLDEDTLHSLLAQFLDLSDYLAVPKLYEMLQNSKNPVYIEELLDTLYFHVGGEQRFAIENMDESKREIEAWMAENKNKKENEE